MYFEAIKSRAAPVVGEDLVAPAPACNLKLPKPIVDSIVNIFTQYSDGIDLGTLVVSRCLLVFNPY